MLATQWTASTSDNESELNPRYNVPIFYYGADPYHRLQASAALEDVSF